MAVGAFCIWSFSSVVGEVAESGKVHVDAAGLAKVVDLPDLVSVRWVYGSMPESGLPPAPVDYDWVTVYAELAPTSWAALETRLGGSKGTSTLEVEESVATELFPAELLSTFSSAPKGSRVGPTAPKGAVRVVSGALYDIGPLRRGHGTGNNAVRIGSSLVFRVDWDRTRHHPASSNSTDTADAS